MKMISIIWIALAFLLVPHFLFMVAWIFVGLLMVGLVACVVTFVVGCVVIWRRSRRGF